MTNGEKEEGEKRLKNGDNGDDTMGDRSETTNGHLTPLSCSCVPGEPVKVGTQNTK